MTDDSKSARPERTRFVPLDPDYASDDRVVELTRDAEWLFLRCIALSFRLLSDGRLTLGQIRRECSDKADEGEITMMLVELEDVGLLVELVPGEWLLPGYVKNNRTAEQVADAQLKKKLGGQLGRHNQYHDDKTVDGCLFCEHPGKSFSSVLAIAGYRCGLATSGDVAKPLPDTDTDTDSYPNGSFHPPGNPRGADSTPAKQETISAGWKPSDGTRDAAGKAGATSAMIERHIPRFRDHHLAKGTRAVDFGPMFVNWIRRALELEHSNGTPPGPAGSTGERRVTAGYHRIIDFTDDQWT